MSNEVGNEMLHHVTKSKERCACHLRPLSASMFLRNGRRCTKKVSRCVVPTVGETPYTVAGETFGVVQDGIHVTGGFSSVVSGDWD